MSLSEILYPLFSTGSTQEDLLFPKRPLDNEMSIHACTTYVKGDLGLGGNRVVQDKHGI